MLTHMLAIFQRLEVSVTVLPGCHNKRYRKFESFEFFKKTLLASCTATPIAGFPFKVWFTALMI
jgi:hypothetical protein